MDASIGQRERTVMYSGFEEASQKDFTNRLISVIMKLPQEEQLRIYNKYTKRRRSFGKVVG